jgi:hypothetical protein
LADFLRLLESRNNRLVWGGMIALAAIAAVRADEIFQYVETIRRVTEAGTVITQDNGIKTLAILASKNDAYRKAIFPYLLQQLQTCRPGDVARYAEIIRAAVDSSNRDDFTDGLKKRLDNLPAAAQARVRRVIRAVG